MPLEHRERCMLNRLKKLYVKYNEVVIYIIVGGATTVVSWVTCFGAKLFLDSNDQVQNLVINTLGWIAGVLFAYPLNRKWVFQSVNPKILRELLDFALSRVSTWVLDILIMWLAVNVWSLDPLLLKIGEKCGKNFAPESVDAINYWIAKIAISSILVTLINYWSSKYIVFKRKIS